MKSLMTHNANYTQRYLNSDSEGWWSTYTMPDPHLSQTGNFSAFPTEAPILFEGALTLLKPEGFSASPKDNKYY